MSLARFSKDSDVYVYGGERGLVCCGCKLYRKPNEDCISYWPDDLTDAEMKEHLLAHIQAGHKVPDRVFELLEA